MSDRVPGRTQRLSSVANAARVLKEFGKGDTQLGVSHLGRRIGVPKSSVHRIVTTLVAEGLLEKVEDTGLFRLTPTMRSIGYSAETTLALHQAATAPLDQLRAQVDHTLHVAILDGTEVIYTERREATAALQLFRAVGQRNSVQLTSTGKVLVAHLPTDQRAVVVDAIRWVRKTPYTITSRTAYLEELDRVRRQGYAENRSESMVGIASIAAPIRDRQGRVVAAVAMVAPVEDPAAGLSHYARLLMDSAARISSALGWRG